MGDGDESINYKFKVNLPQVQVVPTAIPTEATWGVSSISIVAKTNGNYKAAWVLDTGIDTAHPDLNIDPIYSHSFVKGEMVFDTDGHGTQVAGIIGAKANGVGCLGVAPNAPIRALKVIPKNEKIQIIDLLRALNYVYFNCSPGEVMNLSFVRGFGSDADVDLIQLIANRGVYVCIAAGNSSNMEPFKAADIDNYIRGTRKGVYPAAINGDRIYTVSAFQDSLRDADFANFGESVDFMMPGVQIYSTTPGRRYGYSKGASMAAPHLAGLLLLNNGIINSTQQVHCIHDGRDYNVAHE